jgi:hypothetical protein
MIKLYPSRYGDKIVHSGDPAMPIAHVVSVLDLSQLSGPELDALERSPMLGWRRKTCRITVSKWHHHGIRHKWDQRLIN